MSYLESLILGLVQGLGEFLPISSSAHLVVAPWFFNFKDPGLAFDVALHLGTLLAVVFYFWRDWFEILVGSGKFLTGKKSPDTGNQFHTLLALILGTIPAALAGVLLKDLAEHSLRHPLLVAFNMALLGAVLFWVDKKEDARGAQNPPTIVSYQHALIIGISQALALFPGVSRSGITITAALLLGLGRKGAARFSFLLSAPIIFGACVLKAKYFVEIFSSPQAVFGIVVAAVSGFLSIQFLMKLVQNFSYRAFSYYRFAFAAVVVIVYFWR